MATGEGSDEGPAETKLTEQRMVTVPASLRRRLDLEPGDKLRWAVGEEGDFRVEVVHQRAGVFDDFEPVDAGETDAVEAEREFGAE